MKLTQRLSLKLRLTLLFLLLSLAAWFAASVVAWHQTTDKLDKLFDTQQMLFAKRLLTMDVDELRAPERMREVPKKAKHGHLDDDALAFAIFTADGSELVPKLGAGFLVALTGNVLTMPGLPKVPAAMGIDLTDEGVIEGLY